MQGGRFDNDKNFCNRDFWDRRYTENPILGSGIGSRGENLLRKRTIIKTFLESMRPESILDIGCGDHKVIAELELHARYVGIDVSEIIVKENSTRFAGKAFVSADFTDATESIKFKSDVVLCLEVLIHQHVANDYHRLVENLVRSTTRGGLVSGYLSDPRSTVRSQIIAYHEPITDTLDSAGAVNIQVVGESLESHCLAFVAFKVPPTKG